MTHEPEEPGLFDLPLSGPPPEPLAPSAAPAEASRAEPLPRRPARRGPRPEVLPLFDEEELPMTRPGSTLPEPSYAAMPTAPVRGPVPVPRPVASEYAGPSHAVLAVGAPVAAISTRLRAAFGDLAILLAVGAGAAVGATLLGARLGLGSLPALAVFLLAFSFLYCVVSLAFWGQTPGMAWCGLIARSEETEPLSFGQTALRWVGHWLTWILLGLPGLLALSGRSLADRLSGSSTYELPLPGSSAG